MRFVRVFLNAAGEPAHVTEHEGPIITRPLVDGAPLPFVDFGLVHDFDPTDLDGQPCSPARALFVRMEKHPHADSHPDAPKVRLKPAHAGYVWQVFAPCCLATLEAHVRSQGADRLPSVAKAWLAWISPAEQMQRMGLPATVPIAVAKALERQRRGQDAGNVIAQLDRAAQKLSDERSARHLAVRQRAAVAARDQAAAALLAHQQYIAEATAPWFDLNQPTPEAP